MKSRNQVYSWVLEQIINRLVYLFFYTAPFLPRKLMRFIAFFVIVPIYLLRRKYRILIANNLKAVFGNDITALGIQKLIFSVQLNFARYFVDLFYFRDKTEEQIASFLDEVHGVPDFERTLTEGKGAVLLTAHLGNWELGGYFLGQKDLPINVVYFPDRFSMFEKFRSDIRTGRQVKEISVGNGMFAGLPIIKALRQNEMVAMQGDRDFRGDGLEVTFFNHSVTFPAGPVMCAMAAHSPVIPVFILTTPRGKYKIIALEPIIMSGTIKSQDDIRNNVQTVATIIENMIKQYPEQWYCFLPFFERTAGNNQCDENNE